jgi:eukaryotic-like serine/threonine-protein kinase
VVEALENGADEETRQTGAPSESTGGMPVEAWGDEPTRRLDARAEPANVPRQAPIAERLEEGSRVGRFMVLERVGAGGMGVVFRAYDPKLAREVALKCLKPRSLQPEHRRRLVGEAQAMAKLSHPNVVSVYDVLEPQRGEVVVAMEYVPGVNLRRWLGQRARSWEEVLAMLVAAGQGLAAAHAQGLLHRDFKPSNVLVGEDDRPRVTDFGLAKLEGVDSTGPAPARPRAEPLPREPSGLHREAGDDPLTSTGTIVGTPAYMAPEQYAERGVDARADQYAFCSSLWHALTGTLPFGTGSDLGTIIEAKEKGPPQWPKDHPLPRRIVAAILRGMAPRPDDRWPSMAALLEALRWDPRARRRRWMTAAAGLVTVGATGMALSSFQARRAERCSGGQARLAGVWDGDRREAARTAITGAGVAYGQATWEHVAPRLEAYAGAWSGMHREACEATAVRGEQSAEVMDLRMACLERARIGFRAATERLVEADAEVIERAHELVEGLPALERCANVEALRAGVEPPSAEDAEGVGHALEALAEARSLQGIGKAAQASDAIVRAEAALAGSGYEPVRTELTLVRGLVAGTAGEHARAEADLREALGRAARWGQWDELQEAAVELVMLVGRARSLDAEGLRYLELARGLAERSGDARRIARVHVAAGIVDKSHGRYAEAEAEYRAALEGLQGSLGAEHPDVAQARGNLATVLHLLGHSEQAAEQMRAVVATLGRSLGELHPDVLAARNNLAAIEVSQGHLREAEAELRAVVEQRTALLGPHSEGVATARDNLANVLRAQGRLDEAVEEHRAVLEIRREVLGRSHPSLVSSHNNLGAALEAQGRYEEAAVELRAAVGLAEGLGRHDHPTTALARHNLGDVLSSLQRPAEAVEPLERALATRSAPGTPALDRARTAYALAKALVAAGGDPARAVSLAREADTAYVEAGAKHAKEREGVREWLAEREAAGGATSGAAGAPR